MTEHPSGRTALWVVICSAWPLILPILWYKRQIHTIRGVGVSGLPAASQKQFDQLSHMIVSRLTGTAIKFVIVLFLLCLITCLLVIKRSKSGVPAWRLALEIAIGAMALWAVFTIPAMIREGADLLESARAPSTLFPVWAVLSSGLSLLGAERPRPLRVAA